MYEYGPVGGLPPGTTNATVYIIIILLAQNREFWNAIISWSIKLYLLQGLIRHTGGFLSDGTHSGRTFWIRKSSLFEWFPIGDDFDWTGWNLLEIFLKSSWNAKENVICRSICKLPALREKCRNRGRRSSHAASPDRSQTIMKILTIED